MFGRKRGSQGLSRRPIKPGQMTQAAAMVAGPGPHAFANWFIGAAKKADQQYLHDQDPHGIRLGIEIWERTTADGLLKDAPPESLVGAHITVANLYLRRYEIDGQSQDSDRALGYLRQAEQHVIPGSDEDALLKMSSANWFELRYMYAKDRADLDQAIQGYLQVIGILPPTASNRALACGELGRLLLKRFDLTGSALDLAQAQQRLREALHYIEPDNPAKPILEGAWQSSTRKFPTI